MVRAFCLSLLTAHVRQRFLSKAKNTRGICLAVAVSDSLLTPGPSETCIKGHRSSACKHTDRPLFEIKKKGRPVTQCEHCRELRKTKQVHVKCICEIKPDSGPRKGEPIHSSQCSTVGSLIRLLLFPSHSLVGTKAPDSAAFPNGLPQALAMEASVAHIEQHRSPSGRTSYLFILSL
jgi:hypothetical protein